MKKQITWGYPVKSKELAEMRLQEDLQGGFGAMANLKNRNPEIVQRKHKDGSWWYHTIVDDV